MGRANNPGRLGNKISRTGCILVAPAQQERAIPMDCGLPYILVKHKKKMLEFPVLGFSYGPPLILVSEVRSSELIFPV